MSEVSMHICHHTLYEFQLGSNASAATRHICAALVENGAADDCTCQDWFKRFREDDTSQEDHSRSGRPLQSDIEQIKVLIEDNPPLTTRQ